LGGEATQSISLDITAIEVANIKAIVNKSHTSA
jgi:hypothetical protein